MSPLRSRRSASIVALTTLALAAPGLLSGWARASVKPYRAPEPVVRTLPNGLTVAVRVDRRLPIVQMQLVVNAGSAMETPLEPGLASFTAGLLTQGTASRSRSDLMADLTRLGGTLDGSAGREIATLTGAFGAADAEQGLELLADVALHPAFPAQAVEDARSRQVNAVLRAHQDPAVLADEHVTGLALAGDALAHPPLGIPSAIGTFGWSQAQDFHRRCWRPDHALLAIAGDVDPDRMLRAVEEQFGDWAGKGAPPAVAPSTPASGGHIRLIDAPGMRYAEIRLALPGPARGAPDADAITLACALLGGDTGDAPRVTWTGYRERGLVVLAATAPVDSVVATIQDMHETLRHFTGAPPADTELAAVRRRAADASALGFETLGGWISQWMAMRVYGLPEDQLQRHPERIAAVTAAQVGETAHRWLASGSGTLVVVGPARSLQPALAPLGEVEVVAADAPPVPVVLAPSQRREPPTPEEQARGRDQVAKTLAAHGGRATIERIPDSILEGTITINTGTRTLAGTIRELRRTPDRYLLSTIVDHVPTMGGLIGGRGWVGSGARGDTIVDADSAGVAELRASFVADFQHVLLAAAAPTSRVAARGRERLDERDMDVVEVVTADGRRLVLFLDPNDHRLAGAEQAEAGSIDEPVVIRRLWGDYRLVSGVWWPYNEERRVADRTVMVVQLRDVKLGAGLTDAAFERPGTPPPAPASGKGE
ncbi:MAG: M16 family metallopeptidase [Candidatus Eisenbacteria bacterium]